jgi:hypothetical protein
MKDRRIKDDVRITRDEGRSRGEIQDVKLLEGYGMSSIARQPGTRLSLLPGARQWHTPTR